MNFADEMMLSIRRSRMMKELSTKKTIVFILNLLMIAITVHPKIGEAAVKTAKITLETCATGEQTITFYNGRLFWSVEGFWSGDKNANGKADEDEYIAVRPGEGSGCREIAPSFITINDGERVEIPSNEIIFPEIGDERDNFLEKLAVGDTSIEDGWVRLYKLEGWLQYYYWHVHWEGTFDLSKFGIKGLKELIKISNFQYLSSDLTAGPSVSVLPVRKKFLGIEMKTYSRHPAVVFFKPGHQSAFFKLVFNIEYEADEE